MFTLKCDIKIGKFSFTQVNYVTINKSWRTLISTCIIELGGLSTQLNTERKIKPGDKVNVTLWYDENDRSLDKSLEFVGYVSRTLPGFPFRVECEDSTYLLKRTRITKEWKERDPVKLTLKKLVDYLVGEVKAQTKSIDSAIDITVDNRVPDVEFQKFNIQNDNVAQIIHKLKEEHGLAGFFTGVSNTQLYVGLANTLNQGERVKYSFNWNIIENDLIYRTSEEIRLKVKCIGITKDNKKIEPKDTIGDDDGELKTIIVHNVTSEAQLKKQALEEASKMKFDGFDGSITTFLYPYAEPLMVAVLDDPEYGSNRNGEYFIDSVTTEFGVNGARRIVEIGKKIPV